MLNFKLSPHDASYISALLAERPIKEAGRLALEWQRQGDAEVARLEQERREEIKAEVKKEVEAEASGKPSR
jgi:hypothetical protein